MSTNRKEHLRYRYGICLNDSCSKCKSKEVQQIAARKDFVCEECQKPLRECPPPKSFWDKYGKLIIGAGVLIVIICAVVLIMLNRKSGSEIVFEPGTDSVEVIDTINPLPVDTIAPISDEEKSDTIIKNGENKAVTDTVPNKSKDKPESGSRIQVPFGIYSGPQTGLDGEIKVTRSYTLDLRNASHESIELLPGDVITRTKFKNGELVSGYWHRGSQNRSFHR